MLTNGPLLTNKNGLLRPLLHPNHIDVTGKKVMQHTALWINMNPNFHEMTKKLMTSFNKHAKNKVNKTESNLRWWTV